MPSGLTESTGLSNRPTPPIAIKPEKSKKRKFIESSYNHDIKAPVLERIFGYRRQTFVKWENEPGNSTPKIKSKIIQNTSYKHLAKRVYSIEQVRELCGYFRKTGKLDTPPPLPLSIAIWNNKGGVGKSVFAKELAAMMSTLMGFKVLLVDCDSQSDATLLMNCIQNLSKVADANTELQPTLRDLIGYEDMENNKYQSDFEDTILDLSPTLSIIPSDEDISDLDFDFQLLQGLTFDEKSRDISKLVNVSKVISKLYDTCNYDIVIFDCAPNKSLFNLNVLYAADRLIIPVEIEAKCIHSLKRVMNFIGHMQDSLSEEFHFDKMLAVPNKFQSNQLINQQALFRLREIFGDNFLSKAEFSLASAIDRASADRGAIFMRAFDTIKKRSTPMAKKITNNFWMLAHEILDMEPKKLLFPELEQD